MVAMIALLVPFITSTPARAAGPGILNVAIEPVDSLTGEPQTTAAFGTHGDRVGYRISYSCLADVCEDTTIQLAPSQPDPYGLAALANPNTMAKYLIQYENWVAPVGATIAGTDDTGKVISLGTLAPGTSGSFTVVYATETTGTYTTARAAQFYPGGFQILNSATINSPTATAPVTHNANPVTWQSEVPSPVIAKSNPGTVKPDVNVSYNIFMSSGAFVYRDGGSITGTSRWQAAGDYVVVDALPAQAVYVSSTGGGVYDPIGHTVTWTLGTETAPNYGAAGGWGNAGSSGWSGRGTYYSRQVTVQYPATNFPGQVDGCEFTGTVSNSVSATLRYLDSARTVRTTTPATSTHDVSCYAPFARPSLSKLSTRDAGTGNSYLINVPPVVTGMTCPSSGTDQWGRNCSPGATLAAFPVNTNTWTVSAFNGGNVPARATITDTALDQAGAPVIRIQASQSSTIQWTYQCTSGAPVSGTATNVTNVGPLSTTLINQGCRYTSAIATSTTDIAAGNVKPTDTSVGTAYTLTFTYRVTTDANPYIGQSRTNTATATMTYPNNSEITPPAITPASRTVTFRAQPLVAAAKPIFTAGFPTAPSVDGGGFAVPGRDVTFSVRGTTANIPADAEITPQYAFIAPVGWVITPGSAAFSEAIPAGVDFEYRTVTIAGVSRQAVVATWPDSVAFGANTNWPTMTVVAQPTYAVSAGTASVAAAWVTESRQTWDNVAASYTNAVQDTMDLDGDTRTTEWWSSATQNITVQGQSLVSVVKEICLETDGTCTWIADPSRVVPVSTSATGIKYRVTIQNTGNTNLTNVVAYDVLPHPGDTGLTDGTIGTPRNSTFSETLDSVSGVSSNLTLSYSASTNPSRPEVYTGAGTTNDWNSSPSGKAAIRAAVTGTLAPGATAAFSYLADVVAGAAADALACNSVAITTTQTLPSEPLPVCATTAEADLEISTASRLPLQNGRPGVIPFEVVNNGGSQSAPATVEIAVPAGITVTSLTPGGWSCVTDPAAAAPLVGPVDLSCTPVDGTGAARTIEKDIPETIALAVLPTAVATQVCVTAEIVGVMADPDDSNNDTSSCAAVVTATPAIHVTKTDGVTATAIGDQLTYTITVANSLVGEALTDLVITDALPVGTTFVSASDGGTATAGVVTWPATSLGAAGVASGSGGTATGAPGSTLTRTVTVLVTSVATASLTNTASATAPDPADTSLTVSGQGSDTDTLRKASITKSSDAPTVGVRPGDVVTYTVTVTNIGTAPFTTGDPVRVRDLLSGVLDDATFVPGSASISVGGGAATPVGNPSGGVLSWSGALAVSASAELSYQVTVGEGADLRLVNLALTGTGTSCDTATGLGTDDLACAVSSTPFAPDLAKTVQSLEHNADGTWTIVYGIDVVNLDDLAAVTYDLSDALAFGPGIDVVSAAITAAPPGVTALPWAGSGRFVDDATLPAAAVHHYDVTVVAGADLALAGASVACVPGSASGFANTAVLSPLGGDATRAEACASPVSPTVTKTAAPTTQNPDGTWSVVYTITVTAPPSAPATGLAYTLHDELALPAGTSLRTVIVAGPAGALVNPLFDGVSDPAVLTAADRVGTTPRVFTVTITTEAEAGSVDLSTAACPAAGTGGYANGVTLFSGSSAVVVDSADACTPVIPQPTPTIDKRVVSSSVDAVSGDWTLDYEVTVTNPSASYSTSYGLADELQFGDGIAIVSAAAASSDATVDPAWDGIAVTDLVAGVSLDAADSHVYMITVVATPPTVVDATNEAAMDCRLDAGETGTGYRNLATLTSGTVTPRPFAVGCEPAADPSVVKTIAGTPVQDPATGEWSVEYTITVTNRSTSTVIGGIPYTLTDSFGFPTGVTVVDTEVSGPGTLTAGFDGDTQPQLATGAIGAAADEDTPERHVYSVVVTFLAAAGLSTIDRVCDPAQGSGGLRNEIEIAVGVRITADVACANVPEAPIMGVEKSVLSQQQQADGTWIVRYRVTVANPSDEVAGLYTLRDEFTLGAGIELVGTPTITANPATATIDPTWNGADSVVLVENLLLGAGASHQYTVRAVIDSGSVRGTDAAGDCVTDGAETGSGFGNTASVHSGAAVRDAVACATPTDPSVSKSVNSAPVRNADGSWTVAYVITVANPSNTVGLTYELSDDLAFPTGATIDDAIVTSRAGSPTVSSTVDLVGDNVIVPAGTALAAGAIHVFDIVLTATLPADQESIADGFANSAYVASSTDGSVVSDADAAADIDLPELAITKRSDATGVVRIGDVVSYTITVENVGLGDFTTVYPAETWDDLAGVLDDATITTAAAVAPAIGDLTRVGDRLHWVGALAAGDSVEITYAVTVTADGDQQLLNIAFAGSPGTTPATPALDECEDGACAITSTDLPGFLLEKSVSTGVAVPDDEVTYTVVYTNTGVVDVAGATFTDVLQYVLDDATLVSVPTTTTGTVQLDGSALSWTGDLAAGASVTVTYTVIVNGPLSGDGAMHNTAIADADFAMRWPGGECPDGAASCAAPPREVSTETGIRALAFTKSSNATNVAPGQTVSYTLIVTNIGDADYTDADAAVLVDSMAGVLDDARYNDDATATAGVTAFSADALTWTGPLGAGETVTIVYTVTVNSTITGDGRLNNIVGLSPTDLPTSALTECAAEPTDNAQSFCFVSASVSPLASTGIGSLIAPILIGAFTMLLGTVLVLLAVRRRRIEPRPGL